jgi:protein-S-isoprenylcysteine O-methyltransferase Ste14
MDDRDINMVILLIGMASGIFAGFCPSWFTVASPFFHEQGAKNGNVKRIRWGEAAASVLVVAMGWVISSHTKRATPLMASIAISAVFVGGYEYMIAHPSTED